MFYIFIYPYTVQEVPATTGKVKKTHKLSALLTTRENGAVAAQRLHKESTPLSFSKYTSVKAFKQGTERAATAVLCSQKP